MYSFIALRKPFLIILASIAFASCGGGGGSNSTIDPPTPPQTSPPTTPPTAVTTQTGVFVDAPVINIDYRTETQQGVTNEEGEFRFRDGENVVFSIGNLVFPPVAAAAIVTPLDMVPSGDPTDPMLINIVRMLQTLDSNGVPEDGINILESIKTQTLAVEFNETIPQFAADPNVIATIENVLSINGQLRPVDQSLLHLVSELSELDILSDIDTDGDQVPDVIDAAPNDRTAGIDQDGNGEADPFDLTPNSFEFEQQLNVPVNTDVLSEVVTIEGIELEVPVTVSNGEYSINGGDFTSLDGVISNGQTIQIRHTADSRLGESVTTGLTVGNFITGLISVTQTSNSSPVWSLNSLPTPFQQILSEPSSRGSPMSGDIDGDGDEDFVSFSFNGQVSWFENIDREGEFLERLVFFEHLIVGIKLVDFDNDGDLDILVNALEQSFTEFLPRVELLVNDGGNPPGFSERTIISDDLNLNNDLVVEDINGDGFLDVITVSGSGLSLVVHFNNRDGVPTFTSRVIGDFEPLLQNTSITEIEVGDIEGDGDLDVVYSPVGGDRIYYSLNNGSAPIPSFQQREIAISQNTQISGLSVENFDTDVRDEIVVSTADQVLLLDNIGVTSEDFVFNQIFGFQDLSQEDSFSFSEVISNDIDSDGDTDIIFLGPPEVNNVTGIPESETQLVWMEKVSEEFPIFNFHVLSTELSLVTRFSAIDVEGDGVKELVLPDVANANINLLSLVERRLNHPEGELIFGTEPASDPDGNVLEYQILDGADAAQFTIDESGLLSFVSAPSIENPTDLNEDNVYEVRLQVSDGFNSLTRLLQIIPAPDDGDLDDDNVPDEQDAFPNLNAENRDTDNDGIGNQADRDDDNDGVSDTEDDAPLNDVSQTSPSLNSISFLNSPSVITVESESSLVELIDIDQDGDLDIISDDRTGEGVVINLHVNNGGPTPSYTKQTIGEFQSDIRAIIPVDFGNDDDIDLLVSSLEERDLVWFENVGDLSSGFVRHALNINRTPFAVVVGDIDSDGDSDIVVSTSTTNALDREIEVEPIGMFFSLPVVTFSFGELLWYENTGGVTPIFVERVASSFCGCDFIDIVDLDSDGNQDIVTGFTGDENTNISWLRNIGGSNVAFENSETLLLLDGAFESLSEVVPFDVERDGDSDLFLTGESRTHVLINNGQSLQSFSHLRLVDTIPHSLSPLLIDVDNDGDQDIVAMERSVGDDRPPQPEERLIWLEKVNPNSYEFILHELIEIDDQILDFTVGDTNGNGENEIVFVNSGSTQLNQISFIQEQLNYSEGSGLVVTQVSATDDDGNALTYEIIGGADAQFFTINQNSGELSFIASPAVSQSEDFDGDNVYHVRISVSDGSSSVNRLYAVEVVSAL